MKKKSLIITFFVVFNLMLISYNASVNAVYEVDINEAFNFDILKCENNFEIGDISAYAQGFEIDSHHFDQGTAVNLNITNIWPVGLGLEFNISAGGYSEMGGSSLFDYINHETYLKYPQSFLNIYHNISDWNSTTLSVDPGYIFIPFHNNATFLWSIRVDEVEKANNQTLLSDPEFAQALTNGTYTNTTTEFYFEFYMHGIVQHNVTDNGQLFIMTVDVDHHYQFAYNKTDNSMLGFRIVGSLDGNSNDSKLKIEYDYHTELVGYNLPDLTFALKDGGDPSPNGDNLALILGLSIGIPVVLILVTTIVIIVRKKKKQG